MTDSQTEVSAEESGLSTPAIAGPSRRELQRRFMFGISAPEIAG